VALRQARGESVESLAERAGVPARAFRSLEAGDIEMSFLTVLDYCHALDVDLHVGPRDRRTWPGDAPPSIVDILIRG
jgi:transcriptional regulator with XRE-family HTH domain